MKVYCRMCGKPKCIAPCVLARHNKTADEYICIHCFSKTKCKTRTKPNWSYYRKLKRLSIKKEIEINAFGNKI